MSKAEQVPVSISHEWQCLAAALLNRQEEDLRLLGASLHEDLSQRLVMLAFEVDALQHQLPSSIRSIRKALLRLRDTIGDLSEEVNGLAQYIRPATLEHFGLASALRCYLVQVVKQHGLPLTIALRRIPDRIPTDVGYCLFRITQQLLGKLVDGHFRGPVHLVLAGSKAGIRLSFRGPAHLLLPGSVWDREMLMIEARVRLVFGTVRRAADGSRESRLDVRIPLPPTSLRSETGAN